MTPVLDCLTGCEMRHEPMEKMALHRHAEPYAAVVLDGGYEEHGPEGRFACETGSFIVHPAWHQHSDEFSRHGAIVLNLPLQNADGLVCGKVTDLEALQAIARRSPRAAGLAVMEESELARPISPAPWLEAFTALIISNTEHNITDLALRCGVTPEHASRASRRWYGLSPAELRRESRLQQAIRLLNRGASPSQAAAESGFSDQPHLTRLLKNATGRTPAAFRAH